MPTVDNHRRYFKKTADDNFEAQGFYINPFCLDIPAKRVNIDPFCIYIPPKSINIEPLCWNIPSKSIDIDPFCIDLPKWGGTAAPQP